MTRKHFEAIAWQINEHRQHSQVPGASQTLDILARQLAHSFEGFNPNFDRARFLAACGVSK